jgi:hypothetical protein
MPHFVAETCLECGEVVVHDASPEPIDGGKTTFQFEEGVICANCTHDMLADLMAE